MKRASRISFGLVVVVVAVIAAGVAILKSMDFNEYRDLIAAKVEEATGRKVAIAGDLDLGISLTPSLKLEGVTFANADWGSRPEMARLDRLEASVELIPLLSGEARINKIELSGVDLLVETDKDGRGNWEFSVEPEAAAGSGQGGTETGPSEEGGMPVEPVVREIVLKDVNLHYRDGASGQTYDVQVEDLKASADDRSSPIEFDGKGRIADQPFKLEGKIGSLASLMQGAAFPVSVKGEAFEAELGLDGTVAQTQGDAGTDIKFSLTAGDLPKVMESVSALVPGLAGTAVPKSSAELSGQLRQTAKGYALNDLRASLGENTVSGSASVDLGTARPRINVELSSGWLDLQNLKASSPETEKKETAAGNTASAGSKDSDRLFSDEPLGLEGLKAVDGTVSLEAEQVILPNGLNLEQVEAVAVLDRGKLAVSPLRTNLAEGKLDGSITLDASGATAGLDVSLDGEGVLAGNILKQLEVKDLLDGGSTDIEIRLKGTGQSVRALMASLDGGITVQVGEGRLRNKALDLAGGDVIMQVLGGVLPKASQDDYSILSCGVVKFGVKDGLATADKGIAMETEKVNVVGSGTVNLKDETLDLAVVPQAKQGLGIGVGQLVAGLVRVSGTLASPSVGLDEAGAAKSALSVGAALATGGLSALGEALVNRATKDDHPCQTALGKASGSDSGTAAPAAAQEQQNTTETSEEPAEKAKEAIEGVGKALRGLFGGGN